MTKSHPRVGGYPAIDKLDFRLRGNDVVILGCGITGMMTALALSAKGVHSTILEKSKSENFPLDIRTTTFTSKSKNFLENIGIWDHFAGEAGIINDIYILDNKSPSMLHLGQDDKQGPKGYVVPNMLLKEKLFELTQSNPHIKLQKGAEYDIDWLQNNGGTILVCEGRGSALHQIFDAWVEKSYEQTALAFVTHHEKKHEGTSVEHFMPCGTFASLPMKDQNHSSIVWGESTEVAELYEKLPTDKLEMHMQERMGDFLGKTKIVSKVQLFKLSARITKRYYKRNFVLIGDVAHSIHPLAGQGLNQGIKDIESITNIIAARYKLGLELDEIAYAEYEKSRAIGNLSMHLAVDCLNRIFANKNPLLSAWRKFGLRAQNESRFLKKLMLKLGGA